MKAISKLDWLITLSIGDRVIVDSKILIIDGKFPIYKPDLPKWLDKAITKLPISLNSIVFDLAEQIYSNKLVDFTIHLSNGKKVSGIKEVLPFSLGDC
jgi:hypothetical protein